MLEAFITTYYCYVLHSETTLEKIFWYIAYIYAFALVFIPDMKLENGLQFSYEKWQDLVEQYVQKIVYS